MLIVQTLMNGLHIYNRQGKLIWRFDVHSLHPGGPGGSIMGWDVGADGSIYVGTNKNYVYAIDPNFALRWRAKAPGSRDWACTPAVAPDGTVYVGADREQLYAFSADGKQLWHRQVKGMRGFLEPLVAPDGTVYVRTDHLELVALNSQGQELWRTARGATGIDPLTLAPDGTVIAPRVVSGYVTAIRPDGSIGWQVTHAGSAVFGCDNRVPVSNGGEAYYCEESAPGQSQVVAIDTAGTRRWTYQSKGSLSDPVVLPDGRIACVETTIMGGAGSPVLGVMWWIKDLLGTHGSNLLVLRPDGSLDSRLGIDMLYCFAPPAVTAAGEILVLGEDGVLHAYKP